MYDDIIDLLKAHEYFRGISDAVLGEIASLAKATNYDAAAIIHLVNDPLTTVCFILRGGDSWSIASNFGAAPTEAGSKNCRLRLRA